MMRREIFFPRSARCSLVMFERSGHRTTSPTVYWWKLVRTASVDALWSQPSLRSRSGMGLSQAWPLLSRLYPAPLIPARPFGLGWRFDEAPLVAPSRSHGVSCQRYQTHPRNMRRVARIGSARKSRQSIEARRVKTVKLGLIGTTRARCRRQAHMPKSLTNNHSTGGEGV